MGERIRILRPLGQCSVGDYLVVELDGAFLEGQITFLSRTPTGGWIVTFESNTATYEVYCANGVCTLVSRIAEEQWTFEPNARPVADTRTGRRLTLSGE
jgi:hypothetical protein